MYITTCPACGKECGYYLGNQEIKIFCSRDCLVAFDFPRQTHSGGSASPDHPATAIEYLMEHLDEKNEDNYNPFVSDEFVRNLTTRKETTKNLEALVNEIGTTSASAVSILGLNAFTKSCEAITLTPRQIDVIKLVAEGKTNPEIGSELYIDKRTVESHVGSLLGIFGLCNRTQLSVFYLINRDNIYVKAPYSEPKPSVRKIKKIKENPVYRKIEELYSQGIVSYQIVADMVGCSKEYAHNSINRLNREKASSYFAQKLA